MANEFLTYDDLLAVPSVRALSPADALRYLGQLIDLGQMQTDARGAEHALALAAELPIDTWVSADRALLFFFLANAWDDLRHRRIASASDAWKWAPDEFNQSLLYLRRAYNEADFAALGPDARCKILTNLGNNLSTIGRYIEAIEHWNAALAIDPAFPMAQANRGYGRFHYAKTVYDIGHRDALLQGAYDDLCAALDRVPYPDAKAYFTSIRDGILRICRPGSFDVAPTYKEFSLGDTAEEIAYRRWCLKERLFLTPMNDLLTESVAAADVILTPSMVVPVGEPPILQGFFNQLKEEFTTARYLLYQGFFGLAPTFPDRDVKLVNTLDYPSYGFSIESVKLAFRSFYSLFDKIAFFLNRYLVLGIPERGVSFQTLWYEREDRKKGILKPAFDNYPNLPLRGLFWLSRDFDDKDERHLAPDAARLSTIRQHLEHKYLKIHEPEWVLAKGDPLRTDTLAFSIERKEFEAKSLRLARVVRAALLYLVLGIHVEEDHRRGRRGDAIVPGIPLDTYEDEWKQ